MKILETTPIRKNIKVELTPQDMDVIYFAIYKCGGNPNGPRGVAYALADQLYREGARKLKAYYNCTGSSMNYYPETWEYVS